MELTSSMFTENEGSMFDGEEIERKSRVAVELLSIVGNQNAVLRRTIKADVSRALDHNVEANTSIIYMHCTLRADQMIRMRRKRSQPLPRLDACNLKGSDPYK